MLPAATTWLDIEDDGLVEAMEGLFTEDPNTLLVAIASQEEA
jgi:hypothetical protein